MPPPPSQKGTGKKGGRGADARRSRSRNTTPLISSIDADTAYLDVVIKPLRGASYDELVDPSTSSTIPDSKALESVMTRIQSLIDQIEARDEAASKALRKIMAKKNERAAEERENAQRQKDQRDAEEQEKVRKANKKKKSESGRSEKPLTHGMHQLHDGLNLESNSHADEDSTSSPLSTPEPATPGASGAQDKQEANMSQSRDSSEEPEVTRHVPTTRVPVFGDDPTTFPDATVYETRKVDFKTMTDEEIKKIAGVSVFPRKDLRDLIPGDPPNEDFTTKPKIANQVQANTFSTHLEPYFRKFTDEDRAFLRDRGDRRTPFVMPPLGKKHYKQIWAEEDGVPYEEDHKKLPENQARGSIEDMNDEVAETDQLSNGPVTNRLFSLLRFEGRTQSSDPQTGALMFTSADDHNLEMMGADVNAIPPTMTDEPTTSHSFANSSFATSSLDAPSIALPPVPFPPATFMPESNSDAWKKANPPKLDADQMDVRLLQELKYCGFMDENEQPNYEQKLDCQVAERTRELQSKLKELTIKNNARKAILLGLVEDEMAYEEYKSIKDDLGGQVTSAYVKSTRTMAKTKKSKRPGGPSGGNQANAGVARPGVRDGTKVAMDRMGQWVDQVGPAFKDEPNLGKVPRAADPNSSIFSDEAMAPHIARERELFEEEQEGSNYQD